MLWRVHANKTIGKLHKSISVTGKKSPEYTLETTRLEVGKYSRVAETRAAEK